MVALTKPLLRDCFLRLKKACTTHSGTDNYSTQREDEEGNVDYTILITKLFTSWCRIKKESWYLTFYFYFVAVI